MQSCFLVGDKKDPVVFAFIKLSQAWNQSMWLSSGTLPRSFVYCAALLKGTDTKGQDSNFSGAQSRFSEASLRLSKEETSNPCTISCKDAWDWLLLECLHVSIQQLCTVVVRVNCEWWGGHSACLMQGRRNLWSLNLSTSCPTLNFSRCFCWISALTHEAVWVLLKQPRSHAAVSHHPSARDVSHSESLLKARSKFYIWYLNHLFSVNKWDLERRDVKQQINKAVTDFWWTKD